MEKINLSEFKHITDISVRFMDIDALQHVNNARYLNYLEEARISYSKQILGLFEKLDEFNVLVARVEIDFMRPILYNSQVKIYTRVPKVGNKSFTFESIICVEHKEETQMVSRAVQTLVTFNSKTNKSIPVPEELKKKVLKYEGHL